MVVVVPEMKNHTEVVQQEVYTVEALVSRRDLGGSFNWGCMCYRKEHWLVS